jgi:hypothetical protein
MYGPLQRPCLTEHHQPAPNAVLCCSRFGLRRKTTHVVEQVRLVQPLHVVRCLSGGLHQLHPVMHDAVCWTRCHTLHVPLPAGHPSNQLSHHLLAAMRWCLFGSVWPFGGLPAVPAVWLLHGAWDISPKVGGAGLVWLCASSGCSPCLGKEQSQCDIQHDLN